MAKESLDFNQDHQGLKDNYSPAFNNDDYGNKLTNIQLERDMIKKKDAEREAELMRRLADEGVDKLDSGEGTNIDYYINILKKDVEFPDRFENIDSREIQALYGNSYKKFITDLFYDRIQSSKGEKLKAAAFLLMNIEKGGSPYRGLEMYENSGLWVKVLLGKDYYDQFMVDKKNCIDDIQNGSGVDRSALQDVLSTCEMDYIINNIRGSNGKMKYFGFHDNLSGSLLSNEFADRLSSLVKGGFNRSSVIERYEKTMHNDFDLAKNDFERYIKSSRFSGALANLGRMLSLSRNAEQKSESQKCFLVCMLSGVLDIYGQNDIKKQVYQWGKTLGFLPGMLVKNTGHSEQVAELLDDFSNGDFSNHVKSFFHKNDLLKGEIKIGNLIEEVNKWWSIDKMYKFEQYSKFAFFTKSFPLGSSLEQLQKLASNNGVDSSLYY